MHSAHSPSRLLQASFPPEPARSKWDRFNLPASPFVSVPIQFIEILIMIAPSASMPDLLLQQFDGSYPLASIATGVADSIGGILAFVFSPTFGRWSDTYGRKRMMLMLSLLSFLPIFMLSLYPYLSLWFYLSVRGFSKLSAFGVLFSAVADVAPAAQRAKLFGQTTGLGLLAMVGGPFLSLELSAVDSFRVCGGLALVTLAYIFFLMPETLWIGLRRMVQEEDAANEAAKLVGPEMEWSVGSDAGIRTGATPPSKHSSITVNDSAAAASTQEDSLTTSLLSSSPEPTHEQNGVDQPASASAPVPMQPRVIFQPRVVQQRVLNGSSDDCDEDHELPPSLSFTVPALCGDIVVSDPPLAGGSPHSVAVAAASKSMNPCVALRLAFSSASHRQIALVILFSQLAQNGVIEVAMLYLRRHLAFTKTDNSLLLLSMGGWAVVVMCVLMPLMLKRWSEKSVLILSLSMDLIHQLLYLSLPDKKYMYFIAFCQGFGFGSFPASNAVLSGCVSDAEQGAVLSMSAGIRSLTMGLAPVLFNGLFSYFTWDGAPVFLPQAPFCLSALFVFIALLLALRLPHSKHDLAAKEARTQAKLARDQAKPIRSVQEA